MRLRPVLRPSMLLTILLVVTAMVGPAVSAAAPARDATRTVLVRFERGVRAEARDRAVRLAGADLEGKVYGLPVRVVRVPRGRTADEVVARLQALPGVVYAEPNTLARAAAPLPDDPLFPQQWALRNTQQQGGVADADIDAPEGWYLAGMSADTGPWSTAPGPAIGIADSGIDRSNPEFAGRIAACVHFVGVGGTTPARGCRDNYGHGTHVAGTAAAATDNGRGVAGISFTSPLLICKALDRFGFGTRANIAACIVWLHDHGAKVINLSVELAGGRVVRDAVRAAWEHGSAKGSIILAAAGNEGTTTVQYPAGFGAVVSVAATDQSDHRASFSNHNEDVEVAAPGFRILSTCPIGGSALCGGDYGSLNGTSMATAHASGVAAVIRLLHPAATGWEIRTRLDALVDDIDVAGRDQNTGYGRLNLCLAAGGTCPYQPGAQSGVIWGRVWNLATGRGLRGTVEATGPTNRTTSTNAAGFYILSGLAPGDYHLDVTADGCSAGARDVTVAAGDHLERNFRLTCP